MPTEGFNAPWSLVAVIIGFYGLLIIAMLGMISALWLRMGGLQRDFGGLQRELGGLQAEVRLQGQATDYKIDQLRQDMERNIDQLQQDMERNIDQLQQDMERNIDQLQQDMDRNHGQLMRAILAHSHRPDGSLTFDLPPEFNPTPADD